MILAYQCDGAIGYNFARIAGKTDRRVGGRVDMSWALRATSALALAVGALPVQPAAAEPQVGAVGQQEHPGATGTRVSGAARDLVYNETVYADERGERGHNSDHDEPTDRGNKD